MDKAVFKYLKKRGVDVTAPFADDVPFSERAPKFFEWFHKSVLNLDTDEYRREFWHEAYKSGHIIGPVPYTLENYLKRRGVAYRQEAVNIFAYAILLMSSSKSLMPGTRTYLNQNGLPLSSSHWAVWSVCSLLLSVSARCLSGFICFMSRGQGRPLS